MREIKFRGFEPSHKEMIYFHLGNISSGLVGDNDDPIACLHIMQYTGLKDKNGKEIYEGDLVELADVESEPLEVKIGGYWPSDGDSGFGVHVTNQAETYVRGVSPFTTDNNIIVIGNIYENPELLTN